ncbi:hypothetical protein ACFYY8_25690 [Streptosporangium sp. NPDC001559]|uniref:hypothetical protein n=1 Tax=Streptosporangium sp. NPDC001559 TaxID=3366187 RepID=UPI0036F05AF8
MQVFSLDKPPFVGEAVALLLSVEFSRIERDSPPGARLAPPSRIFQLCKGEGRTFKYVEYVLTGLSSEYVLSTLQAALSRRLVR